MSEKRFVIDEKTNYKDYPIILDTKTGDWWVIQDTMMGTEKLLDLLNEQESTIISLKERNKQLRRRLEKINGGYGHLARRNGLTANEWVIESQERELKKKNEQISDWIERHSKDIVRIGEQRATIRQLKEENEHLRQMIKENVFQRYNEGSLADLEFKAIAYNDIVKVEMSNESEPKVIVYCKQGKKENVKSFCQMFIPFGMPYEIKEIE